MVYTGDLLGLLLSHSHISWVVESSPLNMESWAQVRSTTSLEPSRLSHGRQFSLTCVQQPQRGIIVSLPTHGIIQHGLLLDSTRVGFVMT